MGIWKKLGPWFWMMRACLLFRVLLTKRDGVFRRALARAVDRGKCFAYVNNFKVAQCVMVPKRYFFLNPGINIRVLPSDGEAGLFFTTTLCIGRDSNPQSIEFLRMLYRLSYRATAMGILKMAINVFCFTKFSDVRLPQRPF